MKKKYWIKDLTEKQAIHAPTKEIAEKICAKFDELGLKWASGTSYSKENKWGNNHVGAMYYIPKEGLYAEQDSSYREGYETLTIDQLLDFQDLSIEVGKFYRTRGGHKVRIYATDGEGFLPIHGAIFNQNSWFAKTWRNNGKGVYNDIERYDDIVEEWIDEIEFDVETLPKLRYIAMDKDGSWYVYFNKPERRGVYWCAPNGSSGQPIKEKYYPKNYNGSWEDSLHEIVDGELIKVEL